MALKPIALDDLDRQRGGLRLGARRVTFGIHAAEQRNGRLIATYRYRMAPAGEPERPAAPATQVSATASATATARTAAVPTISGNLLANRFKLHGPRVVARGALPKPSEPSVSYVTTGQGGRKRPVRPSQVGRFRVITGDDAR